MSKVAKIWLIIGAALFTAGLIIFAAVMSILGWDFTSLSTVTYETNEYEIGEDYKNISVVTDTADVVLAPSETGKTRIVCEEEVKIKHAVSVKEGTLFIERVDTRKWYEHVGISFKSTRITVYIPTGEYEKLSIRSSTGDVYLPGGFTFGAIDISESTGDVTLKASTTELLKIKTTTGSIRLENASAGALDLSASTGNITAKQVSCTGDVSVNVTTGKAYLEDVSCKSLTSSGSTGSAFLKSVIADKKISVERSTGSISFDASDAAELWVKTTTGSVKGTLLTNKVFFANSSTGNIDVPRTTDGGKSEITTSTGDIKITIK